MKETEIYLKETLGIDVRIQPVVTNKKTNLPLFVWHLYDFYQIRLFNRKIILLKKKTEEHTTAEQLRKHAQLVEQAFDCPVVFVLPFLEAYNRKRLIRRQVAFIVPGKQLFVPQLLIDLRDFRQTVLFKKEKLSPAAQCLFLYHLLKENIEAFPLKEVAKKLGYTQATVTRAVQVLVDKAIATKIAKNKEVRIVFGRDKKELWQNALPLLQNPVQKVYFLERLPQINFIYQASFSALAHYTDLAESETKYFAISQNDFNILKKKEKIQIINTGETEVHLQVWKYAPGLLADDQAVDPLSLYLSLKDQQDERVQKSLDTLLEQLW